MLSMSYKETNDDAAPLSPPAMKIDKKADQTMIRHPPTAYREWKRSGHCHPMAEPH